MDLEQWVKEFRAYCQELGWDCSKAFAASYYHPDEKDMPPQAIVEKVLSYRLNIPDVFWPLKR